MLDWTVVPEVEVPAVDLKELLLTLTEVQNHGKIVNFLQETNGNHHFSDSKNLLFTGFICFMRKQVVSCRFSLESFQWKNGKIWRIHQENRHLSGFNFLLCRCMAMKICQKVTATCPRYLLSLQNRKVDAKLNMVRRLQAWCFQMDLWILNDCAWTIAVTLG